MQRSTDRILTTHTGSLPRPEELIKARSDAGLVDNRAFEALLDNATIDIVGTPGYPGTNTTPPPGFTLASRQTFRGLSLSVFRAPRVVTLTAADFDGFNARVVATGP